MVRRRGARLKWPNDVLVDGRKVAGILVEGRPQEGWAVVGIGLNVALRRADFPAELRETAGTLGFEPDAIEPTLPALLARLERWLAADAGESCSTRCASAMRCSGGRCAGPAAAGVGAGIDDDGRLLVDDRRRDGGARRRRGAPGGGRLSSAAAPPAKRAKPPPRPLAVAT